MSLLLYHPHFGEGEEYSVVCNTHTKNFPLHYHQYNELFLVLKGTMVHIKNGKREKIGSRGFCLMQPDDHHSFSPQNDGEKVVIINCEFSSNILHEIETFLNLSGLVSPPNGWSGTLHNLPAGTWSGLVDKARRLAFYHTHHSTSADARRVLFKSLLIDAFTLLAEPETYMVSNPPRWLSRLRETMNLDENFISGLPRMLELSGYGQEYLNRMMKRYYDETPTEFINRLRIRKAAAMISDGQFNASRIMIECGFNQYSWFHRCFKRHFGMSPSQYLKMSKPAQRKPVNLDITPQVI